MDLKNPVAVYIALNNIEVHCLSELLANNGIESMAVDDLSTGGFFSLGILSQIHRPKIWVASADAERAKELLAKYDREKAQRERLGKESPLVDAVCEECGVTSSFPATRWGYVETCPKCGAFMDVGDDELDGWQTGGEPDA
jgi:hypothetical protein